MAASYYQIFVNLTLLISYLIELIAFLIGPAHFLEKRAEN